MKNVLTAGIELNKYMIRCCFCSWESLSVHNLKYVWTKDVLGSPRDPSTWTELDDFLRTSGLGMNLGVVAVDCGYLAQEAFNFAWFDGKAIYLKTCDGDFYAAKESQGVKKVVFGIDLLTPALKKINDPRMIHPWQAESFLLSYAGLLFMKKQQKSIGE